MTNPNPSPSLDAFSSREVADFHRNSDADSRLEALHHTLGTDVYQAAAGNHIHDGSTGVALLEDVIITGNIGTSSIAVVLKSLLQALSKELGLTDNTTMV